MPKRDAGYMAERREIILDAAQLCLDRAGLDKFTIEQICREAGISTGALYRHFPNKRAILLGLLDRSTDMRDSIVVKSLRELEDVLVGVVKGYDQPGGLEQVRRAFNLIQMSFNDPEMLERAQDSVVGLEGFLNKSLRDIASAGGLPASADIDHAARRIGSLFLGIWLAKAVKPDLDTTRYIDCIKEEFDRLR